MVNESGKVKLLGASIVDDFVVAAPCLLHDKFKAGMEEHFAVALQGGLKQHNGTLHEKKKDENGESHCEAPQEPLIKSMIEQHETVVRKEATLAMTPAHSSKVPKKHEGEPAKIEECWSIGSKASHLSKKTFPELDSPCQELCQFLSNPSQDHWKSLSQLVRHVEAGHFGNKLILRQPLALQIASGAGANHSSRDADCESAMGEPHALGGTYLTSSAKKTCVVMISSAESENHADSNAASEIKFETMLLDEMVLHPDEHQEPALLHNDNLGALHLAKNQHVSPRTKHIQMHEYFVREMQADGTLEMRCKKSENLIPDLFTKNLPEHDHSAHTKNL
jgi:hypothetical protein